MDKIPRQITISLKEYYSLKKQAAELQAYEDAGVDNWSGGDEMDYSEVEEWETKINKLGEKS